MISITNENIFMIISGSLGDKLVPEIEHIIKLRRIYIFCVNQSKHEEWAKNYQKVHGVYTQIKDICHVLKRDVQQSEIDLIPISIVTTKSSSISNEIDQSYTCILNYLKIFFLN